jgi:hypothetical protein
MRRWSRLASAQAALAVAIVTVGVPATITALYDLRFYSTVDPSGSLAKKQAGDTLAALEQETPHSAAEGRDLAFALLAHGNDPDLSGAAQTRVVERAVRGFREYLARVPGDGQAWAGLASGQIRLRDPGRGAEALRMSILMAPWSDTLVQWRCGMAIDLFRALNAEERELMKGQFRVAAQRSAADLVHTVLQRNGTRVARLFLASSPDELIKFETELAKRH